MFDVEENLSAIVNYQLLREARVRFAHEAKAMNSDIFM